MAWILINMGLAAVFGFFLSIYFFLYRMYFPKPWRLLVGSIVGVIMGCLMAVITLMTVWPTVDYRMSIGGMGIIAIMAAAVLLSGNRTVKTINTIKTEKEEVEGNGHVAGCRIDFDPSTGA